MQTNNSLSPSGPGVPHDHPAGHARQLAGHRERAQDQDPQETEGVLLRCQSRTRR